MCEPCLEFPTADETTSNGGAEAAARFAEPRSGLGSAYLCFGFWGNCFLVSNKGTLLAEDLLQRTTRRSPSSLLGLAGPAATASFAYLTATMAWRAHSIHTTS